MKNLKPIRDNILIIPDTIESKGGILVATKNEDKPEIGVVIAVGELVQDVKPQDRILFHKYAPDSISIDNDKFLVIKEEEVIAIITKLKETITGESNGSKSDQKNYRLDTLQPYQDNGKVNPEFVKVYGKERLLAISKGK